MSKFTRCAECPAWYEAICENGGCIRSAKAERVVSALDNYLDAKQCLEVREGADAQCELRAAREELVAALHDLTATNDARKQG